MWCGRASTRTANGILSVDELYVLQRQMSPGFGKDSNNEMSDDDIF